MSGIHLLMLSMMGGAPGVINSALPDASNAFSSEFRLQNDGTFLYGDGAGGSASVNWVTPATAEIVAHYQVQVNLNSGSDTTGTLDSWIDLSTTRTYTKTGAGTAVFRVRIREKGSTVVRTDQTVNIVVS